MVVQSKSLDSLAGETATDSAQRLQSQPLTTTGLTSPNVQNSDYATLSGADKLVSLAKTLADPAYQNKIAQLTGQVRSGRYEGDAGKAGQGLVNDLLHFGPAVGSHK